MRTELKGPIRILALGDSYTIGEGVDEDHRYPDQLRKALQNEGISVEILKIIAKTGWTTDELAEAIKLDKDTLVYDLVFLLVGVNNQYRGYRISDYKKEFEELINRSITFANDDLKKVFVLSIPDYSCTPFAFGSDVNKISGEIDLFNAVNKSLAFQYGINYMDITELSRLASEDPTLVANDGLHPSNQMYQMWVIKLVPEVKKSLNF